MYLQILSCMIKVDPQKKKNTHTDNTHTHTHTQKKKKTDPAKCIKTAQKSANSESREIFEEVPNVCVCVKYR